MRRCLTLMSVMLFVAGISCHANVTRQRIDPIQLRDTTLTFNVNDNVRQLSIEVCGAMMGLKDTNGTNESMWSLTLATLTGECHTITVGWGNEHHGDIDDNRYLSVSGLGDTPVKFTSHVNLYGGDNTLIIEVDDKGRGNVYIGSSDLNYAGSLYLNSAINEVSLSAKGHLNVETMCIECDIMPDLEPGIDVDTIKYMCDATDMIGLTGWWHYLDRDNDSDYARPGGEYLLAIIPDPQLPQSYMIIYMGGASVGTDNWKVGMVKGRLESTRFDGYYKMTWWDAHLNKVDDETSATVDGDILVLNFPLLKSQLRYCR